MTRGPSILADRRSHQAEPGAWSKSFPRLGAASSGAGVALPSALAGRGLSEPG
jgi:hypothetical protein